jgi:hypothetical protein
VEKMAKWKYDPNELKSQAPNVLLKEDTQRWTNVVKIDRDIREKTLKSIMSNFTKEEIKEVMAKHENR